MAAFCRLGRFAEAYTNREHYEAQLREMNKLRQNLTIYDQLLEAQIGGYTAWSGASTQGLEP
jgi:hypothetical protein